MDSVLPGVGLLSQYDTLNHKLFTIDHISFTIIHIWLSTNYQFITHLVRYSKTTAYSSCHQLVQARHIHTERQTHRVT